MPVVLSVPELLVPLDEVLPKLESSFSSMLLMSVPRVWVEVEPEALELVASVVAEPLLSELLLSELPLWLPLGGGGGGPSFSFSSKALRSAELMVVWPELLSVALVPVDDVPSVVDELPSLELLWSLGGGGGVAPANN